MITSASNELRFGGLLRVGAGCGSGCAAGAGASAGGLAAPAAGATTGVDSARSASSPSASIGSSAGSSNSRRVAPNQHLVGVAQAALADALAIDVDAAVAAEALQQHAVEVVQQLDMLACNGVVGQHELALLAAPHAHARRRRRDVQALTGARAAEHDQARRTDARAGA